MIDTIPVRPDERFAIEPVLSFLRTHNSRFDDFDVERVEVEQFPAGQSNLTYLLRCGGWEAVLRRPPLGPVAPRAHDMAREFRILERLHPSFALAPQPYVLCEDASVIGAPFYVMERRHGLVLDQEFPDGWVEKAGLHESIADSLVQVLVDLHAVDWKAAGLDGIGHPEGYMERQVAGWIDRYQRAKTSDLCVADRLFQWFGERQPPSLVPTVIHNDYKLNNLLLDVNDPSRVSAVLDWEMATVGDPLSDLANLLVYWTEPGESALMGGLKSVTAEGGFPTRDEVLQRYAQLSGRDVSQLTWYLAFAYFRVGAICQQIYFRWYKGQTRDERFAGHGEVAMNLIRRAAAIAGQSS